METMYLQIWTYTFTDKSYNKETKDENLKQFPYAINSELIPYRPAKKQEFVCLTKDNLAQLLVLKSDDF
jgi:hypothetical protein